MAYYPNYNPGINSEEEGKMAWDLRQVFAKDIVGETLKLIAIARRSNSYSTWFKLLKRDLATEIAKNLEGEQNKEIQIEIEKVIKVIQKNKQAYLKNNTDPEQHEELENALCRLETLMLTFMQVNGMFGTKEFEDDGL